MDFVFTAMPANYIPDPASFVYAVDGWNTVQFEAPELGAAHQERLAETYYISLDDGIQTPDDLYVEVLVFNQFDDGVYVPWSRTGSSSAPAEYSLEIVLTHELGHTMGLGHDFIDPPTGNNIVSTMYEATDTSWIHDVSDSSEEAARYLYDFGDLPDGVPR